MKKIFTTFIMACVLAVSAMAVSVNDASGVYQGTLNIGGDDYPNEEVYILPGVTANTITFVLPNFQFSGVPLGDIVLVNIPMNGSGQLTLNNRPLYIKAINEHAEVSMVNGSQISGTIANVTLSIEAGLPESIPVVFNGNKVTKRNYELKNGGFEGGWSNNEPTGWHSFPSATGSFAGFVNGTGQFSQSTDVRPGTTGSHSVKIQTKITLGAKGNGNCTNGQINAGSTTATDANGNYNFSDPSNNGYNTEFVGQPDSLVFWAKYIPGGGSVTDNSNKARANAVITQNARYQDPETGSYGSVKVGNAEINYSATSSKGWQRLSTPFVYTSLDPKTAAYILVTFSSNATPGGGNASKNSPDVVYLDDVEIIYNHALSTFKMGNQQISFSNGHANTTAEFSDSDYTFAATTNGKAAKSFIGFDAEHNQVLVYVVADSYSQAKAYSVYTLQMAEPVRDTEYAYSATTCDNEPYSDNLFTDLSEAGAYTTRIPNTKGGDSIITLTLSVLPTYTIPAEATINMGETYTWQGTEYKDLLPGEYNYSETKKTLAGCDSVLTLKLTVKPIPYFFSEAQDACQNEDFVWHGKTLPTAQTGTFMVYDSLSSVYGKDSVFQLTYSVYPTYRFEQTKYVNNVDLVWRGQIIKDLPQAMEPYYYYDNLHTIHGCDSVFVLKLFVSDIPVTYGAYEAFVCEGEQVKFEGVKYVEPFDGEVRVSEPNIYGGDSIVHLTVTVLPSYIVDEYMTMTVGEAQYWEGWNLSSMPVGLYEMEATYYTVDDCDSTVVLHLTVQEETVPTGLPNLPKSAGKVQKVLYNGKIYIIRKDEHIYDILGKKIK